MEDEREPRGRGRPALAASKSTPVHVRMTASAYDAAHARAAAERRSVPALVRDAVGRYLATPDDDRDD